MSIANNYVKIPKTHAQSYFFFFFLFSFLFLFEYYANLNVISIMSNCKVYANMFDY